VILANEKAFPHLLLAKEKALSDLFLGKEEAFPVLFLVKEEEVLVPADEAILAIEPLKRIRQHLLPE
jgi:hypothetical protein